MTPFDAHDASQPLSRGSQELAERLAEKKRMLEMVEYNPADAITIRAKAFQGGKAGRIDAKGYVYDSAGQWVLMVDAKSGNIVTQAGDVLGKFNPNCQYSEHRLCELIEQHDTSKKSGWYAGADDGPVAANAKDWGKEGGSNIWSGANAQAGERADDSSWW